MDSATPLLAGAFSLFPNIVVLLFLMNNDLFMDNLRAIVDIPTGRLVLIFL